MKSGIKTTIGIALSGLIGGLLIVAAMPFYRTYRVLIPALEEARGLLVAGKDQAAIQCCEHMEDALRQYPPLYGEASKIQLHGWAHIGDLVQAEALASNALAFFAAPVQPAASISEWLQAPANAMILQDVQTRYGRPTVESLTETFREELSALRAEKLARTKKAPAKVAADIPTEAAIEDIPEPRFIPKDFPAWAAIKTPDALLRSKTGKATAKIAAGRTLGVKGPRGKLDIYPCLHTSTSGATVVVYIAGKDLDFHPGPLASIKTSVLSLAAKRARLLASIYKLDHLFETANPYSKLLLKVQADKVLLQKKLPALIARRDKASEEQRVEANVKLKALRAQLTALNSKDKMLRKSMAEWAEAKRNDTSHDAERADLKAELTVVKAKLAEALGQ